MAIIPQFSADWFRNDNKLGNITYVGTPCCRTGFCVRRNKEPISDSQIRWIRASVLPIRRVDCCCSPIDRKLTVRIYARPCIRTQKRLNLPRGVNSSVSNVDFFRLTLAAPAYSMGTAIHIERKSRAFLICNLVFGKSGSPQIVCGAANLQRNIESIHSLQVALYYQISRWFPHKKSLNPHNNRVFKLTTY